MKIEKRLLVALLWLIIHKNVPIFNLNIKGFTFSRTTFLKKKKFSTLLEKWVQLIFSLSIDRSFDKNSLNNRARVLKVLEWPILHDNRKITKPAAVKLSRAD